MAAARSAPDQARQAPQRRRIGVLGGTFDPPHLAHVALARAALDELELERVVVVPARSAPHKQGAHGAGAEHRMRMCRIAFAGEPRVELSSIELERQGPSYTADTLRALRAAEPDVELVLIAGADTACSLPGWREPREILRLATLAVAARESLAREAVQNALAGVDEHARPTFLSMPAIGLSSSQVRARARAGEPLGELVGAEVAAYVERHGLYRGGAAAGGGSAAARGAAAGAGERTA